MTSICRYRKGWLWSALGKRHGHYGECTAPGGQSYGRGRGSSQLRRPRRDVSGGSNRKATACHEQHYFHREDTRDRGFAAPKTSRHDHLHRLGQNTHPLLKIKCLEHYRLQTITMVGSQMAWLFNQLNPWRDGLFPMTGLWWFKGPIEWFMCKWKWELKRCN